MLEKYASYNLEKKYYRINRFVVLMVILATTLTAAIETLINYSTYKGPIVLLYLGFIALGIIILITYLLSYITDKQAFLLIVYPLFFVILVPDLKLVFDGDAKFIATYAFQAALFCVLYVAVCAYIVRGIHPYLITGICIIAIVYAVFKYNDPFIKNKIAEIVSILVGFVICQGVYVRLSHKVLHENKLAINKISDQKQEIEEQRNQLRAINRDLNELQSLKNNLIESIIHDLKNPLNAILNYSGSKITKYNRVRINENGRQMLVLVENILNVHAMEKKEPNFSIESVSFTETLNIAVKQVDYLLVSKSLNIQYGFNHHRHILVDASILIRILVNVLTNAIKFSPNNSCIIIETEEKENQCIIRIKDNGSGIPKGFEEKIFEKFMHISTGKKSSSHSSGIGLTFCKMSLNAMDGDIWVSETSDTGTSIAITIPISEQLSKEREQLVKSEMQSEVLLNSESIRFLVPIVRELETVNVYELGKITRILSTIDYSNNSHLESWIEAIKSAVFTANKTRYHELLNQVSLS